MKRHGILLIWSAALSLSGCASYFNTGETDKFACPGIPNGVSCATPREAYNLSHGSTPDTRPVDSAGSATIGKSAPAPDASPVGASPMADFGRAVRGNEPRAVREAATVMRIKIFPWVDQNDDLHMGSVLFTEIQARRWSFGKESRSPVVIRGRPLEDPAPGSEARDQSSAGPILPTARSNPALLPRGGAKGDL